MTRVLHTKRNGTSRQVYHGFASRGEYGLRSFKYFTFNFLGEGAVRDWSKVFRKSGRQRAGAGFRVGVTPLGTNTTAS
jgi:hypothetical protein